MRCKKYSSYEFIDHYAKNTKVTLAYDMGFPDKISYEFIDHLKCTVTKKSPKSVILSNKA